VALAPDEVLVELLEVDGEALTNATPPTLVLLAHAEFSSRDASDVNVMSAHYHWKVSFALLYTLVGVGKVRLTLYSALPLSPVWMTWMVALVPSGMLSLARAARPASRMQNVPLPVWLKPVTSETLKLVTLFPRPRLMYVGAHW